MSDTDSTAKLSSIIQTITKANTYPGTRLASLKTMLSNSGDPLLKNHLGFFKVHINRGTCADIEVQGEGESIDTEHEARVTSRNAHEPA